MTKEEKDLEHIKYLEATYPMGERFRTILTQIQDLLEALNLMEKVRIDKRLLGEAILNYFEDIDRLKDFSEIDRANVNKIYSYEVFWILREKPIQIICDDMDVKFVHINEKICVALLFSNMLAEKNKGYDDYNADALSFMELLLYNFKYRVFSQKSLELMVSGFFCGCGFKS